MEIFPAIDISESQVVRLTQGDFAQKEVYAQNPAEIALRFRAKGAKNLHVVDLDGAKQGTLANFAAIEKIVSESGMFVQVGGGIRDEARIRNYLDLGVSRVILGTVAAEDFTFLEQMVAKFADKIAVGVDARDGKIAVKGWLETTSLDAIAFCEKLDKAGVSTIIYTDIARDGAMQGTNVAVYQTLMEKINCQIVASGGISSLAELETLKQMNIYGAILGKSLYTGAIRLEEAIGS